SFGLASFAPESTLPSARPPPSASAASSPPSRSPVAFESPQPGPSAARTIIERSAERREESRFVMAYSVIRECRLGRALFASCLDNRTVSAAVGEREREEDRAHLVLSRATDLH